jgi:hypothetical protein
MSNDGIRVLTILPADEGGILAAAAVALLSGNEPPSIEDALPEGLKTADPPNVVVPLGSRTAGEIDILSFAPEASVNFLVPAVLGVSDSAEIPHDLSGVPLFSDPFVGSHLTCGRTPAIGSIEDVREKLNVDTLAAYGLNGSNVAVALVDIGIYLPYLTKKLGPTPRLDVSNSWTPNWLTSRPGRHRIGHGTMCAYDVLISAPKATLLDFAALLGRSPGDHSVGTTIGTVSQAYFKLLWIWAIIPQLSHIRPPYNGLVINNSWTIFHPCWEDFPRNHPGRYIDNPNHPFHYLVAVLAEVGADIVFAAGNCGAQCPSPVCLHRSAGSIMGASAYPEVLTIAGCDTRDKRVGYSSQGPSIAGLPPEKPDLTAYTHFLGSEVEGRGRPDAGTSAACPVAAGCIAALRTKASPDRVPPSSLFAELKSSARQTSGAGWNRDYGFGIIDPVSAASALGLLD